MKVARFERIVQQRKTISLARQVDRFPEVIGTSHAFGGHLGCLTQRVDNGALAVVLDAHQRALRSFPVLAPTDVKMITGLPPSRTAACKAKLLNFGP